MFNPLKRLAENYKVRRAEKVRLTDHETWLDIQWPVNARANRRLAERKAARQQRRGQRAYFRAERLKAYRRDTLEAQARVLRELPVDHPVRRNVERSIAWQQASRG